MESRCSSMKGVWSNPGIHRDSVSTPEYCWYIAHIAMHVVCLYRHIHVIPTFNGVNMAEYLHPGRGVVKPSDPKG